jgi:uncharacterized protein
MILVDSWAWIALADKSDSYHRKAKTVHNRLRQARLRYVTTDYILSETISYLYPAIGPAKAGGFINIILASAAAGQYILVHLSPQQFHRAWELRQKYHDKPNISFVDFSSMTVMQDLGITEIFSGDAHFQHVNLGFQLIPGCA